MNAKCRLLCLREMFIKYTDQNNYVSIEKIQNYLSSCGYPAHKITIKDDIDALISSGMEIEYMTVHFCPTTALMSAFRSILHESR